MKKIISIGVVLWMVILQVAGQTSNSSFLSNGFKVIPLGVKG
jgi:hypothetical protein